MEYTENRKNYQYLLLTGFLIAVFAGTFTPVFQGLISVWSNSEDYSHGFLIIPISLYIIWRKKEQLAAVDLNPSASGAVIVVVSLLVYVFSRYAGILSLAPVAMLAAVVGSVIYLFGFKMLRALAFPIFFLFLMVPIPSQIYSAMTLPLQLFVTQTTVEIARLFAVPILNEGNVIHLADRTLQVVAACSGMRSMISLFAICAIFGYFTLDSNVTRIILCACSVFIAVFINVVRVLSMVLAHQYFQYDLTHGTVHSIFGIMIFVLALVMVYIIQSILSQGEARFGVSE